MKRNKSAQPTRVMPKRSSTRPSVVEEPTIKKRKPKAKMKSATLADDKEESTSVMENNLASASCASPDANCSICLCAIDNRAFTDSCYHTFCFKCLLEWSRVRAVCPLCKKSFSAIVHDFRSYDNYQLYQLPRQDQIDDTDDVRLSSAHIFGRSMPSSAPSMGAHPAIALFHPVGFWISPDNHAARLRHAEQMIAFRRRVYTEELHLQGVWSSSGHIVRLGYVSPSLFACNPLLIERVRPWILRDLHVIISRFEVPVVCNIVLELLRQFEITSEDFYGRLFPHLGLSTRLFLQELDSFARSPYDIATYDELAIYNTSTVPQRQSSSHVENISSSDDSDVEITRSETFSVGTRSPFPATQQQQQVNGLFAALRNRVWSAVNQGWDSPIPGPSRYSFTSPQDAGFTSDSNSNTVGVSVIDDMHNNSCDESDRLATAISDCGSDVVVIDSNNARQSPITLLSSSDTDDEITVLCPNDVRQSRRQLRKKKRQVIPATNESQLIGELTNDNASPSRDGKNSMQIILHEDSCIRLTAVEVPDQHKVVRQQAVFENNRPVGQNPDRDASDLSTMSNVTCDHNDALTQSQPVSSTELVMTSVSRSIRTKRTRSVSNVESEGNDKSLKLPACKKHISGHKSSKRKFSDALLETPTEATKMSKCEALDGMTATGCSVDDETNISGDSKRASNITDPDNSAISNKDSCCREDGDSKSEQREQDSEAKCIDSCGNEQCDNDHNATQTGGCLWTEDINHVSDIPCRDTDSSLVDGDFQSGDWKSTSNLNCSNKQCIWNNTSFIDEDNQTLEAENSKSAIMCSDSASVDEICTPVVSACQVAYKALEHNIDVLKTKMTANSDVMFSCEELASVEQRSTDLLTSAPAIDMRSGNGDLQSSDNMVKLWLSNVNTRSVDNTKSSYNNPKCSKRGASAVEIVSTSYENSNDGELDVTGSQVNGSFEQFNAISESVIANSPASSSNALMTDHQFDMGYLHRSHQNADANIHVIDDSDDDCISIEEDLESSDSEIEWLPDMSNESNIRSQRCISVSSDDASYTVDIELLHDDVSNDNEVTGLTAQTSAEQVSVNNSLGLSERDDFIIINDPHPENLCYRKQETEQIVSNMPSSYCDTEQSSSYMKDCEPERNTVDLNDINNSSANDLCCRKHESEQIDSKMPTPYCNTEQSSSYMKDCEPERNTVDLNDINNSSANLCCRKHESEQIDSNIPSSYCDREQSSNYMKDCESERNSVESVDLIDVDDSSANDLCCRIKETEQIDSNIPSSYCDREQSSSYMKDCESERNSVESVDLIDVDDSSANDLCCRIKETEQIDSIIPSSYCDTEQSSSYMKDCESERNAVESVDLIDVNDSSANDFCCRKQETEQIDSKMPTPYCNTEQSSSYMKDCESERNTVESVDLIDVNDSSANDLCCRKQETEQIDSKMPTPYCNTEQSSSYMKDCESERNTVESVDLIDVNDSSAIDLCCRKQETEQIDSKMSTPYCNTEQSSSYMKDCESERNLVNLISIDDPSVNDLCFGKLETPSVSEHTDSKVLLPYFDMAQSSSYGNDGESDNKQASLVSDPLSNASVQVLDSASDPQTSRDHETDTLLLDRDNSISSIAGDSSTCHSYCQQLTADQQFCNSFSSERNIGLDESVDCMNRSTDASTVDNSISTVNSQLCKSFHGLSEN